MSKRATVNVTIPAEYGDDTQGERVTLRCDAAPLNGAGEVEFVGAPNAGLDVVGRIHLVIDTPALLPPNGGEVGPWLADARMERGWVRCRWLAERELQRSHPRPYGWTVM